LKSILKEAVRGLVPDKIIDRPKQGFGAPMDKWLRGEFGRVVQSELEPSRFFDFFPADRSQVLNILQRHRRGQADFALYIWTFYNAVAWFDSWIEGVLGYTSHVKLLDLARRAAGMLLRYLVRRGLTEIFRWARAGRLRRRLMQLTGAELAYLAGKKSLAEVWSEVSSKGFLLSKSERKSLAEVMRTDYPKQTETLKETAQKDLAHKFDLLGSGATSLGPEIDWHWDFKSGRRWELQPSHLIEYVELGQPSDVKVPWELSRCQHLVALGRAWIVFREESYVREFKNQVRSWMRSNPVGLGVNWSCAMEVALRALSWIWALDFFDDAPLGDEFREEILLSLYQHVLWISENLETGSVNGNHFISDALGMVACGSIFSAVPEARGWLEQGASLLEQEIRLQVDDKGVDIEASTAYQRLVLEICLSQYDPYRPPGDQSVSFFPGSMESAR